MIKRLAILNGLAIIAVVFNHAAGIGQIAMFLWTDRYRPVSVPNWDQIGSLAYYALLTIRQLAVFSVPAFLFVSGFFLAYAARGNERGVNWRVVRIRIVSLLIPYAIWSIAGFILNYIQGERYSPLDVLGTFVSQGALGPYWFMPMLIYMYLLSPFIVYLAKANWKILIIISAILQSLPVVANYSGLFNLNVQFLDFMQKISPGWSPLNWILFFSIGIVAGTNLSPFKLWLTRYKYVFLVALPVTALLNVLESDWLLQSTRSNWGAYQGTMSFNLYVLVFIFCFLAFENVQTPFARPLSQVGMKSLGIYLVHYFALLILAKTIYHLIPVILGNPLIFLPLLILVGLGVPLVFMFIIEKTFLRPSYRYLFG